MKVRGASVAPRRRTSRPKSGRPAQKSGSPASLATGAFWFLGITILLGAVAGEWLHTHYTLSFQSPLRLKFQSPLVVAERITSEDAAEAQADQHGRGLTAWQQYACRKFGTDCRLALAIQRAENPQGQCEIYHYNSDGTLDWGYFQINTVHLKRPGLNLRDLLDCKANIDFAYQLYRERAGFSPWSTFKDGKYKQFMKD